MQTSFRWSIEADYLGEFGQTGATVAARALRQRRRQDMRVVEFRISQPQIEALVSTDHVLISRKGEPNDKVFRISTVRSVPTLETVQREVAVVVARC
jgi:hypothetical protein